MAWLAKVCLFAVFLTAAVGIAISIFDNRIAGASRDHKGFFVSILEPIYLALLKAFVVSYLALIAIVTAVVIYFSFYALIWSFAAPPEFAPYAILVSLWLGISGLIVLPVAYKKGNFDESPYSIKLSPDSEPRLFELAEDLAGRYSVSPPAEIFLTPGAKIELREPASTFDEVYSGALARLEIGLAAFQFLTATDLGILMARQFAASDDKRNPAFAFIKRLKWRLETISLNLMKTGPLIYLNPAAWLGIAAAPITDLISSGWQTSSELALDDEVAGYYGKNRLRIAIARYEIETERLRGLIIEGRLKHRSGLRKIEDLYSSMRQRGLDSASDVLTFAEKFYDIDSRFMGDDKSATIRLRLKRLPEVPDISLDINLPAHGFLNNRRKIEELMMSLLNG